MFFWASHVTRHWTLDSTAALSGKYIDNLVVAGHVAKILKAHYARLRNSKPTQVKFVIKHDWKQEPLRRSKFDIQ